MDANNLLCWIVGVASLGNTAALLVLQRGRGSTWYLSYGINAFVLTVFLVWRPDIAGFLAAPFFALTVLFPPWLVNGAAYASTRHHHALAFALAKVATLLHPFGLFDTHARLLEAMWRLERGDVARAKTLLAAMPNDLARAQLLRIDGNFAALRAFIEANDARKLNPVLAPLHMRSVCETGTAREITDLLGAWQQRGLTGELSALVTLTAAATLGHTGLVHALFAGPLATYAREVQRFWTLSAAQAAGRTDEAQQGFTRLRDESGAAMKLAAQQRIDRPLTPLPIDDEQRAWLAKLEAEVIAFERPRRLLPATTALVLLNVIMFAIEIPGDVRSNVNLYNLGALEIPMRSLTDAWRLVTACFLHYGWLHLIMNMIGLSLFGPVVERALGLRRYLVVYLGSGVSSMAVYAALAVVTDVSNLVAGASGCIMGLIGSLLGITLGEWLETKSTVMRQRMLLILIIFAGQTLFDIFTPHIAMFVHDAGALIGCLLGLSLRPRRVTA